MLWRGLSPLLVAHNYDGVELWAGRNNTESGVRALHRWESKLSCQFASSLPLLSVNYKGAWPALNLSCWQESCTSWLVAFFFIYRLAHEERQTWTVPLRTLQPWVFVPPLFFCIFVPFHPWTSLQWQRKCEGQCETWNAILTFLKWFCVSWRSFATVDVRACVCECVCVCEPLSTFPFVAMSSCFWFPLYLTVHFLRVFHICAHVD